MVAMIPSPSSLTLVATLLCVVRGGSAAAVAEEASDDFTAPWFCHGIDCPPFSNTSVSGVEVRTYSQYLWASTNVSGVSLDDAENVGFDRLFDYISGANKAGATINMTSPVLNRVVPGAGPNCNSTFIISFFTPFAYQKGGDKAAAGPPVPTADSDVYVGTIGPLTVAVSEFGGFATQAELIARAARLTSEVEAADGLKPTAEMPGGDDSWFFAGYDPPFRLTGRHNEVWLPVEVL